MWHGLSAIFPCTRYMCDTCGYHAPSHITKMCVAWEARLNMSSISYVTWLYIAMLLAIDLNTIVWCHIHKLTEIPGQTCAPRTKGQMFGSQKVQSTNQHLTHIYSSTLEKHLKEDILGSSFCMSVVKRHSAILMSQGPPTFHIHAVVGWGMAAANNQLLDARDT